MPTEGLEANVEGEHTFSLHLAGTRTRCDRESFRRTSGGGARTGGALEDEIEYGDPPKGKHEEPGTLDKAAPLKNHVVLKKSGRHEVVEGP